jgi:hypothetical protein
MLWTWKQDKLGWWLGARDGFDGTARVFSRDGVWCLRIDSGFNGSAVLSHFSEGYLSDGKAKKSADHWASVSARVRSRAASRSYAART